jgi:hypothetical protein
MAQVQNKISVNGELAVVVNTGSEIINVYFSENSGKICTRGKIDTLTDVLHPGIVIGKDKTGREWIAHNHYAHGKPMFEILDGYCKGRTVEWDNRIVNYSPKEIVKRAIAEQLKGKSYNAITYNCQTFVNIVVQNKPSSEAIDKLSDSGLFIGTILGGIGLASKNKFLINSALTILGVSGAAKLFSR